MRPLRSRSPFARVAVFAFAAAVALGATYPFAEAATPRIVRDVIVDADVPPAFDGARVVFVADVHAGPYLRKGRMHKLVETINGLDPDVLLLGGDYVGGRSDGAEIFYPEARQFDASLAKVAVLGNHEYYEGVENAERGLAKSGLTLLKNDSILVSKDGETIRIGGLDDLSEGSVDMTATSEGIDTDEFAILVSHEPDAFVDEMPSAHGAWDLGLAGHTHGGQMTLFGAAPIVPSRYPDRVRTGWAEASGVPILVTNGVGTVTLPIRLAAPPQIHVIELRRS